MTAAFLISWKGKGVFEDLEWEDGCGEQGILFGRRGIGSKSSMACPHGMILLLCLVGDLPKMVS